MTGQAEHLPVTLWNAMAARPWKLPSSQRKVDRQSGRKKVLFVVLVCLAGKHPVDERSMACFRLGLRLKGLPVTMIKQ